jgi:hypothetical protein
MSQPQNEANSTLIPLAKQQTGQRVRKLLHITAMVCVINALCFLFGGLLMIMESNDEIGGLLFCLAFSVVFFIAFKHYITKATSKESIRITPDTFSIVNNSFFRKSELQYEVAGITNMQYRGRKHMTDHPLKGNSFDYLGFQTQQELIDTVHDEGNISFEYEGKTVYFGKSVPSWDAEELDKQLRLVTAGRLYIQNLPESIEDVGAF